MNIEQLYKDIEYMERRRKKLEEIDKREREFMERFAYEISVGINPVEKMTDEEFMKEYMKSECSPIEKLEDEMKRKITNTNEKTAMRVLKSEFPLSRYKHYDEEIVYYGDKQKKKQEKNDE